MAKPLSERWEEEYNRQVADLIGHLEAFIDGEFGQRCETFEADCPTCKLWKMRDDIETVIK